MKIINICICSCKRQRSLENCLLKLREIEIPSDVITYVSIIDNDPAKSAEQVYLNNLEHPHLTFYYFHETRRGIPFARNRAISESTFLNADVIVFIDDDEWPETDWLMHLYSYYNDSPKDIIVSGHVISDLPDDTEEEMRMLFNKRFRKTGMQLTSCATNNVLIPMDIIQQSGVRFDDTNPLAGGTDTIFFCQLVEQGYCIEKCAEAIVHEIIPVSRLNIEWMTKRKYRAGITAAWRKQKNGRSKLAIAVAASCSIVKEGVKWACYSVIQKTLQRNIAKLAFYKSLGVLSGTFGRKVESYKTVDGS